MADESTTGGMPAADNVTFEAWIESQPEEIRTRFEQGTQGLRSALKSERDNTKSLSGQLKELQEKVTAGSEAARQIEMLQAQLADSEKKRVEAERKESFAASAAGAGCANAKAAYAIAVSGDLFKKDGMPDWEAIKAEAPELFGVKQPAGHAGTGTGGDPNAGKSNYMDDMIRGRLRR